MENRSSSREYINYYTIRKERSTENSLSSNDSNQVETPKYIRKRDIKRLIKTNEVFKVLKNASSFWENINKKKF